MNRGPGVDRTDLTDRVHIALLERIEAGDWGRLYGALLLLDEASALELAADAGHPEWPTQAIRALALYGIRRQQGADG